MDIADRDGGRRNRGRLIEMWNATLVLRSRVKLGGGDFQCLLDCRKLRGQWKSFERGGENSAGAGGAAGRRIKLGQRQRCAQFEAARALLLRDRDSGQECVFRRRRVGGIALEEDFSTRPIQFCFERATGRALIRQQRFVKESGGPVEIASPCFRLGERDAAQVKEGENVLFAHLLDGATHFLKPAGRTRCGS